MTDENGAPPEPKAEPKAEAKPASTDNAPVSVTVPAAHFKAVPSRPTPKQD